MQYIILYRHYYNSEMAIISKDVFLIRKKTYISNWKHRIGNKIEWSCEYISKYGYDFARKMQRGGVLTVQIAKKIAVDYSVHR